MYLLKSEGTGLCWSMVWVVCGAVRRSGAERVWAEEEILYFRVGKYFTLANSVDLRYLLGQL
jgi:hypothetical protein